MLSLISDWARVGRTREVSLGHPADLARSQAMELRRRLREGESLNLNLGNPMDSADALNAACLAVGEECRTSPDRALAEASALWCAIEESPWTEDELDERSALFCSLAFTAWRAARMLDLPAAAYAWERAYQEKLRGSLHWDVAAAEAEFEGRSALRDLVKDSENVFRILTYLHDQRESDPRKVAVQAAALHDFILASNPDFPSDLGSFFLGFSARIAGIANRALGMFAETNRWLDAAERHFQECPDSRSQLGRVTYQRLTLFYSLARFEPIVKVAPTLETTFVELGMSEDYFKVRILWAASLKCSGETERACGILEPLLNRCSEMSPEMYGWTLMELGDMSLINGDYELGFSRLTQAEQLLRDTNQRTGWATCIGMMGFGYRSQGNFRQAIQLFRSAQAEYGLLGMTALEAYARLLVSEAYLGMGRWRVAEEEAREIIPIFERHGMVAEGVAAAALLREAHRRRQLDPQMFRELRERFRPGSR